MDARTVIKLAGFGLLMIQLCCAADSATCTEQLEACKENVIVLELEKKACDVKSGNHLIKYHNENTRLKKELDKTQENLELHLDLYDRSLESIAEYAELTQELEWKVDKEKKSNKKLRSKIKKLEANLAASPDLSEASRKDKIEVEELQARINELQENLKTKDQDLIKKNDELLNAENEILDLRKENENLKRSEDITKQRVAHLRENSKKNIKFVTEKYQEYEEKIKEKEAALRKAEQSLFLSEENVKGLEKDLQKMKKSNEKKKAKISNLEEKIKDIETTKSESNDRLRRLTDQMNGDLTELERKRKECLSLYRKTRDSLEEALTIKIKCLNDIKHLEEEAAVHKECLKELDETKGSLKKKNRRVTEVSHDLKTCEERLDQKKKLLKTMSDKWRRSLTGERSRGKPGKRERKRKSKERQGKQETIKEDESLCKSDLEKCQNHLAFRETEKKDCHEQMDRYASKMAELTEEKNQCNSELKRTVEIMKAREASLKEPKLKKKMPRKAEVSDKEQLRSCSKENKILKDEVANLEKVVQAKKDMHARCTKANLSMKQKVDDLTRDNVKLERAKEVLEKKVPELEGQLEKGKEDEKILSKKKRTVELKLASCEKAKTEYEETKTALADQVLRCAKEVDELRAVSDAFDKGQKELKTLRAEMKELKGKLEKSEQSGKRLELDIKSSRAKLTECSDSVRSISETYHQVLQERDNYKYEAEKCLEVPASEASDMFKEEKKAHEETKMTLAEKEWELGDCESTKKALSDHVLRLGEEVDRYRTNEDGTLTVSCGDIEDQNKRLQEQVDRAKDELEIMKEKMQAAASLTPNKMTQMELQGCDRMYKELEEVVAGLYKKVDALEQQLKQSEDDLKSCTSGRCPYRQKSIVFPIEKLNCSTPEDLPYDFGTDVEKLVDTIKHLNHLGIDCKHSKQKLKVSRWFLQKRAEAQEKNLTIANEEIENLKEKHKACKTELKNSGNAGSPEQQQALEDCNKQLKTCNDERQASGKQGEKDDGKAVEGDAGTGGNPEKELERCNSKHQECINSKDKQGNQLKACTKERDKLRMEVYKMEHDLQDCNNSWSEMERERDQLVATNEMIRLVADKEGEERNEINDTLSKKIASSKKRVEKLRLYLAIAVIVILVLVTVKVVGVIKERIEDHHESVKLQKQQEKAERERKGRKKRQ